MRSMISVLFMLLMSPGGMMEIGETLRPFTSTFGMSVVSFGAAGFVTTCKMPPSSALTRLKQQVSNAPTYKSNRCQFPGELDEVMQDEA